MEEEGSETGDWITTYADMVTLLLTFFIMLFSMSVMDAQKFREILTSIQKSLGAPQAVVELVVPGVGPETAQEKEKPDVKLPELPEPVVEDVDWKLLSDVQEAIQKTRLGEHVVVYREQNRIIIRVEGQVFFESGQALLNPEASPILDDIAGIIREYPEYKVNIEGHTDNVPISTPLFPSNWELSAIRATTVLRYLVDRDVNPRRLTATGYGELLPLVPNETPENRAMNRRVEFVLEKSKK